MSTAGPTGPVATPVAPAAVPPLVSTAAPRAPAVPLSAWAWVLVLCLAQVVSTMDRGMLALVIDPVRADLGISELQVALLLGFAFALFYVTVGLPMGLLADRVNRRRLLIAGILVWSLATFAGGLARDFGELFASRLFIGIGEAVLAPCAVTLIADAFPAAARGRPMAVYVYGTMTAYGVGSLLSGYVLQLAPTGAFDAIPRAAGPRAVADRLPVRGRHRSAGRRAAAAAARARQAGGRRDGGRHAA